MRASALACLVLLAQPALAQWSGWDYQNDRPKEQFKELEGKPPAYPRDDNLLPFETSAASPHKYYIDSKSLSVGQDGVVRYTLVVRTGGGATNISYEGIRCDLQQVKIYASGRSDGTWVPARDPQWVGIVAQPVDIHHSVLLHDYLCFGKSSKTPVAQIQDALNLLRYGVPEKIRE